MNSGNFADPAYQAWPVGLYYTAVRKGELLRALRDQFSARGDYVYFEVGPRMKKIKRGLGDARITDQEYEDLLKKRKAQITTPPLPLPYDAPFMDLLIERIEETNFGERVFPWSPKTAWNIIDRAFGAYNHFFRLSRITWFFSPHPELGRPRGFSIPEVRSWTGLSLAALDYYIGLADMADMGRGMYRQQMGAK